LEQIDQHVESLIFTSGQPISEADITTSIQRTLDENISKEEVDASIERLIEKYGSDQYAFEIVPISKGYHFMTKGAFHTTVGEHLKVISKKKLSRAALETLSIVAYKQPVTRIELESIRGVSCDYTIQKLMEKELVEMQGRADGPGRPLLYGTSEKFMDYFGIKDLKDLPKPKDFEMPETEVGEPAPIEVVIPKEGNESRDEDATQDVAYDKLSADKEALKNTAVERDETGSDVESGEIDSMLEVDEVRSEANTLDESIAEEHAEAVIAESIDIVNYVSQKEQVLQAEADMKAEVDGEEDMEVENSIELEEEMASAIDIQSEENVEIRGGIEGEVSGIIEEEESKGDLEEQIFLKEGLVEQEEENDEMLEAQSREQKGIKNDIVAEMSEVKEEPGKEEIITTINSFSEEE